jgi:hypothetical protein
LDKDAKEIEIPKKDNDASYWIGAMNKVMNDLVIRCLPKDWKIVKDDYNSEIKIFIMISDQNVDDQEEQDQKKSSEPICVCGTHQGRKGDGVGIFITFRTKEADQNKSCCYCPEATVLHELIHAATGIPDNYDNTAKHDYYIDACVHLALKKAGVGNCVNTLPNPNPGCKCIDHNGNESPCNKEREEVKSKN